MAAPRARLPILAAMTLSGVVFLSLAALGWRGWRPLLADPARVAGLMVVVLMTVAASFSGINARGFQRPDAELRWLAVPVILLTILLAWLPAETDCRDLWTLDGSAVRVLGVALLAIGGVLRVVPMFVLGERFTWPLASQESHRLVTTGLYRFVRHPSYLGALLGGIGWVLLFRSLAGLLLMLLLATLCVPVVRREEEILQIEFGEDYSAYRRRSWRLIPWVF